MIKQIFKKIIEPYIPISLFLTLLTITGIWIAGGILLNNSFKELLPIYWIGYLIWLVSIIMSITLTVSRFKKVQNDLDNITWPVHRLKSKIRAVRSDLQVSILDLKKSLLEELAPINRQSAIESLHRFSDQEDLQTRAAIIGKLSPSSAFQLLSKFPEEGQLEIMSALAKISMVPVKQIGEINDKMNATLGFGFPDNTDIASGLAAVVRILRLVPVQFERKVCDYIENEDKQLATSIRNRVNAFEELTKYPDWAVQILLKKLESKLLCQALKGANQELREKFYHNMSAQAHNMLQDELDYMGNISQREISEAQYMVMEIVSQLEESGEINRADVADQETF